MLDAGLGRPNGVQTKALNRAAKGTLERLPRDLMSWLSAREDKEFRFRAGVSCLTSRIMTVASPSLKETELGPLPADWGIVSIEESCEKPQYGFTATASLDPVGPHFLRITDIQAGRVDWERVPFCRCSEETKEQYRLRAGDLLFARIGATTGKTFLVRSCPQAVFASYLIRVRPSTVEPDFLYYFCSSEMYWRQINANKGDKLKGGISGSLLAQVRHCLPPLPEQRAIAYVLSKIQGAVEVQEKIIATLRELKAATMAKLFRKGLRGEPLKQTGIGEIPESWNPQPLGQVLLQAQYGLSVRGERSGRYPILRMNCQQDGRVVLRDLQYVDLDDATFRGYKLGEGDLLFNRTNSINLVGRTAIFRGGLDAVFASYLLRLRLDKESVTPGFLNYYLNLPSTQAALRGLATRAVGQANISASKLKLFAIPVPPDRKEQDAIVGILDELSTTLVRADERRRRLRALFSSVLDQLVTGQVRVTRKMIALQALADRAARRPKWSGRVDEKVLEEIVKRIVEAVSPERIILFGSAARGEMGPDSDVDLLVVKACENRREVWKKIAWSLIGTGVPKDIIVATPEDIEQYGATIGLIYRPALREGRVIYAA